MAKKFFMINSGTFDLAPVNVTWRFLLFYHLE